tara:strand:- start:3667 stop:4344 length:678 start_codon:yes stop_codon:yes gene_type:complete
MPEKVTRQEKIIELAILKARETIEALRDGEKIEPYDMEKVKRPKAQSYKADYKQDPDHANAGPKKEGFTSIKKAFNKKAMIKSVRKARRAVLILDAKVAQLKSKGPMSEEDAKLAKEMTEQADEAERLMSEGIKRLDKVRGGFDGFKVDDEKKSLNFKKDDRDVEFTEEEQRQADIVLEALNNVVRETTQKLLTATTQELGKLLAELKEAVRDLKEISLFTGRSA